MYRLVYWTDRYPHISRHCWSNCVASTTRVLARGVPVVPKSSCLQTRWPGEPPGQPTRRENIRREWCSRGGEAMPGWTGQAEESSGRQRCTRRWVHHHRRCRSRDEERSRPKGPEDHCEPRRTASRQKGRGSEGIGRRGPPLSVGELVVGYASRGVEMDHDLLRRDLILWLYDRMLGQTD
jgi:hypothetical protein